MISKESEAISRILELNDRKLAVSFSGGKDSLVVLDLAVRTGITNVVFSDTSMEFPETLEYVREVSLFYGLDIKIVTAPVTLYEMIEYIGVPSRRLRWCCEVLKFGPISRYAIENNIEGFITGLRKKESNRRKNYKFIDNNPMVPVSQINPILEWDDSDVWEYIATNRLPYNSLYNEFDRVGCWCCPYRTEKDWQKTEEIHPEMIDEFNKSLESWAHKLKIQDKEKFISGRGWNAWATPRRSLYIGTQKTINNGNSCKVILSFSTKFEHYSSRINEILPIISTDYHINNSNIEITIDKNKTSHFRILIEKAINCVGCGACTARCKRGALSISNGHLILDITKCNQCEECLRASKLGLRGACIIRNYAPNRTKLLDI
ncbi:MAG: hypothetical protein FP824_02385 [Euryarchaeota archaeon]|nr:hypothetical protein [Euryarchaeota archaeon]